MNLHNQSAENGRAAFIVELVNLHGNVDVMILRRPVLTNAIHIRFTAVDRDDTRNIA